MILAEDIGLEALPEELTLGKLREQTKDMSDDTQIHFIHREDILSDEGRDIHYTPSVLWRTEEGSEEEVVTLVSVIDPVILGGEEEDDLESMTFPESVN